MLPGKKGRKWRFGALLERNIVDIFPCRSNHALATIFACKSLRECVSIYLSLSLNNGAAVLGASLRFTLSHVQKTDEENPRKRSVFSSVRYRIYEFVTS